MRGFRKRHYHNVSDLRHDLATLARERRRIKSSQGGAMIEKAFQERLMLAVTEVNGCRYCAYAHARIALSAGLSRSDVEALAAGDLEGSPPEQIPALLYARHWAETDGRPDLEARRRVLEIYGQDMTEAIELSMRVIRVANLAGNTWDYVLYRLSFGRWGGQ